MKNIILSMLIFVSGFAYSTGSDGSSGITESNSISNKECKIVLLKTGSDGSSGVESKNTTLFVRVLVCNEISR